MGVEKKIWKFKIHSIKTADFNIPLSKYSLKKAFKNFGIDFVSVFQKRKVMTIRLLNNLHEQKNFLHKKFQCCEFATLTDSE